MHPGEVFAGLHLTLLSMSAMALAQHLRVPRTRIECLIKGTTSMTPDAALRLSRAFNTTPNYWMNMQVNYDMAAVVQAGDVLEIKRLMA